MVYAAGSETKEFLTINRAAEIYPIGRGRLRRLMTSGEIPFINLSGRYLVRPERIEEWLKKQETTAGVAR